MTTRKLPPNSPAPAVSSTSKYSRAACSVCGLLGLSIIALSQIQIANAAILLDFEDLTDLQSVGDTYSPVGIHFANAVALTAGFSLNEFDYPPSSGVMAVGDDNGTMGLTFDTPVTSLSAHFTYGSQLTFSAFDQSHNLLGTFLTSNASNLGTSDVVAIPFTGISELQISDAISDTFILDDLRWTPVPEPLEYASLTVVMLTATALFRRLKQIVQGSV